MTGALIFVKVNDNEADNYTAYNEAEAPEIVNDSPEILPESSTVQTLTLSENPIEKTPKFKAWPTEKAEHHKAAYESAPVMARVQQTEETESIDIDKTDNSGTEEVAAAGIEAWFKYRTRCGRGREFVIDGQIRAESSDGFQSA